jgi:hypothetical protein
MASVVVAVIGSLLGVALGISAQYLQAQRTHRDQVNDALRDTKRRVYAEFLRSISASYAQAKSGSGYSGDASLLQATAEIELLAGPEVAIQARQLSEQVIGVHARLRDDPAVDQTEVPGVDRDRMRLVELFQHDLQLAPRRKRPHEGPEPGS